MEILNCLAQERGYKVEYNPQQHAIPLKQGATDDKYAIISFCKLDFEWNEKRYFYLNLNISF